MNIKQIAPKIIRKDSVRNLIILSIEIQKSVCDLCKLYKPESEFVETYYKGKPEKTCEDCYNLTHDHTLDDAKNAAYDAKELS